MDDFERELALSQVRALERIGTGLLRLAAVEEQREERARRAEKTPVNRRRRLRG